MSMIVNARRGVAAMMLLSAATACVKEDGQKTPLGSTPAPAAEAAAPAGAPAAKPAADLTPAAQEALNAGNTAYKAKDYKAALAAYQKASAESPNHAAPWFGIYMVAKATNDAKGADAALAEIRKRNEAPPMEHTQGDTASMRKAHEKAGVPSPTKG